MGKIKIGILIFTNKIKERDLSDSYFDNKKFYGLNAILSEIDCNKYEIDYISSININNYDFVLIPIISYYDALNYINEIAFKKVTTKLIVGGPYVLNYNTFFNSFATVLGRCENMINQIFDKQNFDNVIYNDNLKDKYNVGELRKFLCIGKKNEVAIGCSAKCYFCQYAWKNKYKSINENRYSSGVSDFEDYIQNLDLTKNGRFVTAIDGLTEESRYRVNKRISDTDIESKFLEAIENNISGLLKIYNIVGYPWENDVDFSKIIDIVKKIDSKKTNKLTIYLTHSHFIPKIMTPMEDFKINLIDARKKIVKTPVLYNEDKYFKIANNISITSNSSAIEEYIVDRADNMNDIEKIKNILCSNKYLTLNNELKLKVLQKHFEKFINGYIGNYRLIYTHNLEKLKLKLTQIN